MQSIISFSYFSVIKLTNLSRDTQFCKKASLNKELTNVQPLLINQTNTISGKGDALYIPPVGAFWKAAVKRGSQDCSNRPTTAWILLQS